MKFGIFYELQLPRPWGPDSEFDLYQNALSQLELADALGYDYAWEVEHHFLEEYSHSSAPEVFLSAASQRTKRIRVGHGIFQLTTNHPAMVAEMVSALDLISNGRVELGMGESASITELTPFKVRFDEKREIWEDAVRCLIPMFGDGGVEYHGPHFDFPLRNVLPKPRQKAAPAAVDRLLAAADHRLCRRKGHRRARLPVRQRRRGPRLGPCLLQRHHQAAGQAGRLSGQSQHRAGLDVHVRQDR